MAQAFAFPSYPPIGPWELYIGLLIWIPALMRLLLLSKPGYLVIKAFMPDKALPLRKIFEWWKELPIKGVGVFLLNEIIMFVTIPIVAFSFRVFSDPIGWQTWEETSQGGVIFIILGFSLWVIYDIFLILKSRRILKVLARKDIEKITFIADYIMKGRRFLRGVAKPVLGVDEKGEIDVKKHAGRGILRSLLMGGNLIGGAIGGWGFGLAMKSVQSAAGKVSEKIDEKLQEQFDRITKRNGIDMAKKIVINILMGLGPILILLIAHGLF